MSESFPYRNVKASHLDMSHRIESGHSEISERESEVHQVSR
jgi:hypothetical protein